MKTVWQIDLARAHHIFLSTRLSFLWKYGLWKWKDEGKKKKHVLGSISYTEGRICFQDLGAKGLPGFNPDGKTRRWIKVQAPPSWHTQALSTSKAFLWQFNTALSVFLLQQCIYSCRLHQLRSLQSMSSKLDKLSFQIKTNKLINKPNRPKRGMHVQAFNVKPSSREHNCIIPT